MKQLCCVLTALLLVCITPISAFASETMLDCMPTNGLNAKSGEQITFTPSDVISVSFNEARVNKFSGLMCSEFIGAGVNSDLITIKCKALANLVIEMTINRNTGTFDNYLVDENDTVTFWIKGICKKSSKKF